MTINNITVPSYGGRELVQKHLTNNNSSLAVFFPGKNYSCEKPLLYYVMKSATACNYDALLLEYGYQAARSEFNPDDMELIINECCQSINQVCGNYNKIVFVSKSLGTYIAARASELINTGEIAHMYLTPIKSTIPFINNSKGIALWGTADKIINEEDVKQIEESPRVTLHKVAEANHALEVENLDQSLNIMKTIIEISDQFFTKLAV